MGRQFGKMSASIFREHWVGAAQKIKMGYTGINRRKLASCYITIAVPDMTAAAGNTAFSNRGDPDG